MKGVQCYELFGGIALKNHTFFGQPLLFFLPLQLSDVVLVVVVDAVVVELPQTPEDDL